MGQSVPEMCSNDRILSEAGCVIIDHVKVQHVKNVTNTNFAW